MAEFSIKDLESLSGIKAHTIRMWEQRYDLLNPGRTDTNIRFYRDEDLKLLLNVSLLCQMGYRISKVAKMSEEEMSKIIAESASVDSEESHLLNIMKLAMLNYDELLFNNVMDRFLADHDVEQAFKSIFIPFLSQIGVLWQTSAICPAQEHFVSNLIRQKVYTYVDALPVEVRDDQKIYVLYLPEEEMHDLGLLMLHYVFRFAGHRSIFLGQNVPLSDLDQVVDRLGPVTFVSFLTSCHVQGDIEKYFTHLVESFADTNCTFHFTGAATVGKTSPRKELIRIHDSAESILSSLV
ncbi:MerR family transcriptional regulator [Halocola ammonii]